MKTSFLLKLATIAAFTSLAYGADLDLEKGSSAANFIEYDIDEESNYDNIRFGVGGGTYGGINLNVNNVLNATNIIISNGNYGTHNFKVNDGAKVYATNLTYQGSGGTTTLTVFGGGTMEVENVTYASGNRTPLCL